MQRSRFSERGGRSHLQNSDRDRSPTNTGQDRRDGSDGDNLESGDINSRIFVGRLTPEITRYMLQHQFSKWGVIMGIKLTSDNVGYVQFRNEEEAKTCLACGPTITINGVQLDIKPAGGRGQSGFGSHDMGDSNRRGGRGAGINKHYGDRRDSREFDTGRDPPRFQSRGEFKGRESSHMDGDFEDSYRNRDYYRHSEIGGNGYYGREAPPYNPRSVYEPLPYSPTTAPLDPLDPARPNDIEIVVPNKMQRAFAENIEARLKRLNLMVDLLFPPPNLLPERVVKDLTDRHCLYAIFATAENEKHNSLTLNILHGDPQEHRNMPVEDALRLIQQNFEEYVKKTRLRNLREVVPRDVRSLLLDLLEMRPLSMVDLDKIVKYLRDRQNALLEDQIELKRESAGLGQLPQNVLSSTMAVTYPGYSNYVAQGASASAAIGATPVQPSAAMAATTNMASLGLAAAPNMVGAYATTAYSGIQGLQPHGMQQNAGLIGSYGMPQPVAANKQATEIHLQERILNIMKGSPSMQVPTGVPAPSGVPPPPPIIQSLQQQQQSSAWMSREQSKRSDDASGVEQGNQAPYNPWSQ